MARGRFGNRVSPRFAGRGVKPTRTWITANQGFLFSAVTATTANVVMRMEGPTDPTNLTSDPPEDITILRVKGSFFVQLSATAATAAWILALTVQDTTWTPGATFPGDADKRILWQRCYQKGATNATHSWWSPGYLEIASTAFVEQTGMCDIDIAPKVKLEPGKALYLVAYEEDGSSTFSLASNDNVRILFQRTSRRR